MKKNRNEREDVKRSYAIDSVVTGPIRRDNENGSDVQPEEKFEKGSSCAVHLQG